MTEGTEGGGLQRGVATPAAEPEAGPGTMEETEAALAGLETDAPRVGIIMGSKSDMEVMEQAGAVLEERGIRYEMRVTASRGGGTSGTGRRR